MSALPLEGELFAGKYRIGRVLGTGGMAAVLEAHHVGLDEKVALKLLLPECCDDPVVVERFVQEGKTASKIRSEHVVRMLDVGVDSGRAYLVMECLRGQDLEALVRGGGALPCSTAVDLLLQACEAIGEGHALGIIHRDLKPANIFLTHRADGTPSVKVLDFGISKMPRGAAGAASSAHPTLPSMVMGSPEYMSPEQMTSAVMADQRSDIWSLGTILYELLTGQVAFGGSTTTEVCARVLQGTPVPSLELRPDLPAGVGHVIDRCLERDSARRYGNVAELARALAPFGSADARASADSIARVVEGRPAEATPEVRPPMRSGAGTMKPTAAEILAIRPARGRRVSGYLVGAALAFGGLGVGAGFLLGVGPFRGHVAASSSGVAAPVIASALPISSASPDAAPAASAPPSPSAVAKHRRRAVNAAAPPTVPGALQDAATADRDDDPYE